MKKNIKKAGKPAPTVKSKSGKAKPQVKGSSKPAKSLKLKVNSTLKPVPKATAKPAAKSVAKSAANVKAPPQKEMKPLAKPAAKAPMIEVKPGAKGVVGPKIKLSKEEKKAQVMAQIVALQKEESEVVLTNADGKQYCKVHDCDQGQTTEGYCRLHYIAFWKRNRSKVKILEGGKLDKYIEDLTNKYPDKYLEMLRKDLSSEKDFNLIVAEMDVEDSGDDNDSEEDASRFIEEVRGGVPTSDDDEGGF